MAESWRGIGIAKKLLTTLGANLPTESIIALQTDVKNPVNQLYESMGFSRVLTVVVGEHEDNVWTIKTQAL